MLLPAHSKASPPDPVALAGTIDHHTEDDDNVLLSWSLVVGCQPKISTHAVPAVLMLLAPFSSSSFKAKSTDASGGEAEKTKRRGGGG